MGSEVVEVTSFKLLWCVRAGEEITMPKWGVPVARLVAIRKIGRDRKVWVGDGTEPATFGAIGERASSEARVVSGIG